MFPLTLYPIHFYMFLNNLLDYHFQLSITFQRRLLFIFIAKRFESPFLILKSKKGTKFMSISYQITDADLPAWWTFRQTEFKMLSCMCRIGTFLQSVPKTTDATFLSSQVLKGKYCNESQSPVNIKGDPIS